MLFTKVKSILQEKKKTQSAILLKGFAHILPFAHKLCELAHKLINKGYFLLSEVVNMVGLQTEVSKRKSKHRMIILGLIFIILAVITFIFLKWDVASIIFVILGIIAIILGMFYKPKKFT
jgi:hypothetical protein